MTNAMPSLQMTIKLSYGWRPFGPPRRALFLSIRIPDRKQTKMVLFFIGYPYYTKGFQKRLPLRKFSSSAASRSARLPAMAA